MNRKSHPPLRVTLLLAALILLAGCTPEETPVSAPQAQEALPAQTESAAAPTFTSPPPTAQPTLPPPTETPPALQALPPEPQVVAFAAADGQALQGVYYPAAVNPSPVIVLMHWVRGNQSDWDAIAVWLQNRGVPSRTAVPLYPWQDPSWFPPLPQDFSIGVFTFSFRGCETAQGCGSFDPEGWLLDAQAAMMTAVVLPGVDPARVITAGASIGADGAVDGCIYLNEKNPISCQGAFSLSPGGYLSVAYADAVFRMQHPAVGLTALPTWCLADETEINICNEAADPTFTAYQVREFPGAGHGMMILSPSVEPSGMQALLDFIQQAAGIPAP